MTFVTGIRAFANDKQTEGQLHLMELATFL